MAGILTISLTKKDYRLGKGRTMARGISVPKMMEDAMREVLGQVAQNVISKLPSRRMRAHTKIEYKRTPQGASAHLIVGEGVPFTNVQAKWGTRPTIILPKGDNKHLAIPLNAFAKGLQNKVGSLRAYGNMLHPKWFGYGVRGTELFYGKGNTPAFQLVTKAVVKPSVNLYDVADEMKALTAISLQRKFGDYDFGYTSVRKG